MKHKSRWVMLGCGLAFVAAMAGVWVSMASPSPHTRLPVDTVGTGDIEKVVLVTGILKPAVQVNVGAQVNGQLRKLYVRQGERVKKGQLLAEIDPTLQESELRNTKAQLASAERKSALRRQCCCATARSWTDSA
ncbi:Macrolide-specific efflux protein [Enterobacter cloacae]|uniref:Macrolide-specific efflux protein n=1 Tax=Enterobacter cloacae TaxID=550 RepID=A0A377M9K1_ENTCL|nr:Macrolide-specific efflux protein [Enterobacter cloacae]